MKTLLTGCLALLGLACGAATVELGPKGELKMEKVSFYGSVFDANWKSYGQIYRYFEVTSRKPEQVTGEFKSEGLPKIELTSALKREGDSFRYSAVCRFGEERDWKAVALAARLPVDEFRGRTLLVNGKPLVLPAEAKAGKDAALFQGEVTELVIPLTEGKLVLKGGFQLRIQDDRAYGQSAYMLRIGFRRDSATLYSLELTCSAPAYQSTPVDLRGAVNMGFADEVADDRKGGWTDQGSDNDLRMLKPGRKSLGGIDFDLIDPAANGGKSCLMLAGPNRDYFPKNAEVEVAGKARGNYLYLLHALAWASDKKEIGKISITYTDGTSAVIPVTGNVDVGNWWEPRPRSNGEVVWMGENKSSYVGLYRSCFPIADKPVARIGFTSTGVSVWGIAALSLGMEAVPRRESASVYVVAGKDYQPMNYAKDTEKGSALDFSGRLDAPAGKYGRIIINGDGKFEFENARGVPVRFYGANLCNTAQYLNKEWAERLADRLAAAGYNAIRLHHHDAGLSQRTDTSSTGLNLERLTELDYLIHCLKQRGIYITIDLYVSRPLVKGEIPEFPGETVGRTAFKPLAYLLDSAMKNWEEFTRNWLTHINPYTGFALKDDPALIGISLINEGNLNTTSQADPFVARAYRQAFAAWVKGKSFAAGTTETQKFAAFLLELHVKGYERMRYFLTTLGVKAPLSDMNMRSAPLLSVIRDRYDYVDNHQYWAHPSFPEKRWQLPSVATTGSVLAGMSVPGFLFPSRLYRKPMMITEFDYAYPNRCRAEGGVVMASYAALQDWDGLFQFAYAHREVCVTKNLPPVSQFDTSTDPVKTLSQRIGAALFLDGGLKPATLKYAVLLNGAEKLTFEQQYPRELLRLGLVAQVGTVVMEKGFDPVKLPEGLTGLVNLGYNFPPVPASYRVLGVSELPLPDPEKCDASNGQLFLNSKKETLRVETPTCEALILPAGMKGEGKFLQVENRVGRGVFAAISLDGKPLVKAERVLILHLTDSHATKTRFGGLTQDRFEAWGVLPYLAARGEANLTLTPGDGPWQLYALDAAGKRLGETPFTFTEGKLSFKANVFAKSGTVPAYELTK